MALKFGTFKKTKSWCNILTSKSTNSQQYMVSSVSMTLRKYHTIQSEVDPTSVIWGHACMEHRYTTRKKT